MNNGEVEDLETGSLFRCPNCKSLCDIDDFTPTLRFASLIECPNCIRLVKPNNHAKVSDIPNIF